MRKSLWRARNEWVPQVSLLRPGAFGVTTALTDCIGSAIFIPRWADALHDAIAGVCESSAFIQYPTQAHLGMISLLEASKSRIP